jgi:hypothetical protein
MGGCFTADMSSGPPELSEGLPEFPQGLPVLFFYEDPKEKRQRIEGAKPPRPTVPLPVPGPGPALDYPLLAFPWEPWLAGRETQSGALAYAAWLNEIAAERLAAIVPLLARAGAPVAALRDDPAGLADLGEWVQRAFPVLAGPEIEQDCLSDTANYRLGSAYQARGPGMQGYSRHLDALSGSVAHDLALIVADCVRAVRPGPAWQCFFDLDHNGYVIGFDDERPQTDLIGEIATFLTQTAARPRGVRGHHLRAWYALTLRRGYDRAVSGTAVPEAWDAFPDAHDMRGYPRRPVSLPARPNPGPPRPSWSRPSSCSGPRAGSRPSSGAAASWPRRCSPAGASTRAPTSRSTPLSCTGTCCCWTTAAPGPTT